MTVLTIRDLTKRYRAPDGAELPVLDLPALDLAAGAALAVVGPSGSGKTTLFNIVAGLLLPTSGAVTISGQRIDQLSEAQRDQFRARQIGYVFQTPNLLASFSALENVLLAMGFAGTVPPRQRRSRAAELLEQVGLAARLHHRPAQLSSGQQQRVALARALANCPALLLADEPTAHVDAANGAQIVALLRAQQCEHDAALLFASHDPAVLAGFEQRLELAPTGVAEMTR